MKLSAFPPVSSSQATVLILGSMPGIASLDEQRYYAHPRNVFWRLMGRCLGFDHSSYHTCLSTLNKNGIALWDVLKHCERPGSLDSNIVEASVECNDFSEFLNHHGNVTTLLFNGKTAERLFRKHALKKLETSQDTIPVMTSLPSSSPAMAALNFEQKLELWQSALEKAGICCSAIKDKL